MSYNTAEGDAKGGFERVTPTVDAPKTRLQKCGCRQSALS